MLGVVAMRLHPSANAFTRATLVPNVTDLSTLNLWASIAFAFAGLELSSTMGEETANPTTRPAARDRHLRAADRGGLHPRHVVGAVARADERPQHRVRVPAGDHRRERGGVAGARVARAGGGGALHAEQRGGRGRVALRAGARGVRDRTGSLLPAGVREGASAMRTPYVAILVQAALATVFLLVSQLGKGSTVEQAYLVLLDTQLLVYFIPYVYLFLCLLRQARGPSAERVSYRAGGWARRSRACAGSRITVFAMVVASIPPADAPNRFGVRREGDRRRGGVRRARRPSSTGARDGSVRA